MIVCVTDDRADPGGDRFDRQSSHMLHAEANLLRGYAEQLVTTGSISIERPAGVVTARFRGPAWRYRGLLTWQRRPEMGLDAVRTDGSGRAGMLDGPMVSKYHDRANLIHEIMLHLAIHLTWLEEDE